MPDRERSRLRCVTPFLRCRSIDEAIEFFVDTLGFTLDVKADNFARVSRDEVMFLLYGEGVQLAPRGGGRYTSYIDVDDADALYAELKPKLDRLPPGHVGPPADMEYGQRDFWVLGPDGDIIAFGSPLECDGE
jgi:catechol 2,3-dioxygenase-like lactoylglutathione lyase family enzyme